MSNKTQAREMMEKMRDLGNLDPKFEEMTSHPNTGTQLMNFPSNYRGLAKVTRVKDDAAKTWMGIDMPIYVDMENGETNLLTPAGQMATIADVSKLFD